MNELVQAELIHCDKKDEQYSKISINNPEFVIGRSRNASFVILSLQVSKSQCVFRKKNDVWTICDESSYGTFVDGMKLNKNVPVVVSDGACIEFGLSGRFKFKFHTKCSSSPHKRTKMSENEDSKKTQEDELQTKRMKMSSNEKLRGEHSEEKRIAEKKLLYEKKLLEDKVKEMEKLLEEKEKAQELLNKKLQEKENERLRELELLQKSKEAQVKAVMENLKREVAEREEAVRIKLTREIKNLQDEKVKLENDIRGELCKKEGESAKNLKQLQEELGKVKRDLMNMEGKKQYLEKELEETTKAKEDASDTCLKTKEQVLHDFGELMETELQCNICSELFVIATTLNCTHTFCKYCITEWKKKKKECPVCRTKITSQNRSLALDNFIDKMISNLSDEMKERRQEIVDERQVQKNKAGSTKRSPRERRLNQIPSSSSENTENTSQNNDVIVISSETSDSESELRNSSGLSDYMDEDDYMEGDARAYYGGYGHCYRCGRRGHWANGCPERY